MPIVDITSIVVRNRQRTEKDAKHIRELKDSILARGNLHPPVCTRDPTTEEWILVAGECRFEAIKLIASEQKTYVVDNREIPPGKIVFLSLMDSLDEADIFEAEFDENFRRRDLSWQDRTAALAHLHKLRQSENPGQTRRATAAELVATGATKSQTFAEQQIREAMAIQQHINNPKIAQARNHREAYAAVLRQEEERALAAIARRQVASASEAPSLVEVRNADLLDAMCKMEPNQFDLICADPPYGIGADTAGFRDRTAVHHNYDDSPETAKSIAQCILREGFRITKTRANLFMFTDIQHWNWLQEASARMGWTPFRTPVLWQKSDSEGLAPWGSSGFRRTYEVLFYATKNARGLLSSPVDILRVNRVPRNERIHAAEKPVELMRRLIECATLPGDYVLDPCCGSGSTLVAANETKRRALGLEKDKDFYNTALANVTRKEGGQLGTKNSA